MVTKAFLAVLGALSEADHSNILVTTYEIGDTGEDIEMSLRFGPAGVDTSTDVLVDDNERLSHQAGDINLPLGKDADLLGATLTCSTTVVTTERSGAPADTELTFSISGGPQSFSHSLSITAANVGDSVKFAISITFIFA